MGRKKASNERHGGRSDRRRAVAPGTESRIAGGAARPDDDYWVPGDDKLSSRLVRVAAPLLDEMPEDAPFAHRKLACELAAVAWNRSLPAGCAMPQAMLRVADPCAPELLQLLEKLQTRRRALFPDDRRCILDVAVHRSAGGEVRLEVASTKPAGPQWLARLAGLG